MVFKKIRGTMNIIYIFISIFFSTLHAAQQEKQLGFHERPFMSEGHRNLIRQNFSKEDYPDGRPVDNYPHFFAIKHLSDCKRLAGEYRIVFETRHIPFPEPFSAQELKKLDKLREERRIPAHDFEIRDINEPCIIDIFSELFDKLKAQSEIIKECEKKECEKDVFFSEITNYLNLAKKLQEAGVKINEKSRDNSYLFNFPITLNKKVLRKHFSNDTKYSLEELLSYHSDGRYIK